MDFAWPCPRPVTGQGVVEMSKRNLAAVADFVQSHGCAAIVRKDRVEFAVVYISAATGELVQEVMAAATIEDARRALDC